MDAFTSLGDIRDDPLESVKGIKGRLPRLVLRDLRTVTYVSFAKGEGGEGMITLTFPAGKSLDSLADQHFPALRVQLRQSADFYRARGYDFKDDSHLAHKR